MAKMNTGSMEQMQIQQQMQQKYMEFQMYEEQMARIKEEIERMANQVGEVQYLIASLDDFKNIKKNTEVLTPLSNGIFIETKIINTTKLIINVGNNTMVEKTVDETKEMLDKQLVEIRNIRSTLVEQYNTLALKHAELTEELNSLLVQ